MHQRTARTRLAVDIGGTFTDVVLELPDGQRISTKCLTTYAHPGLAVLEGIARVLKQAGIQPGQVDLLIHGTTLATNALIERRGARTALLTTAGHRDVLALAHEDRFEQYDINIDRPRPLVPRQLRLPIVERIDAHGQVRVPLEPDSVQSAIAVLHREGIESVAIGFLHAYANPVHEQQLAEILRAALPRVSITLSSEVCPEIREYERFSTACANAYVQPLMQRYLHRLEQELKQQGLNCPFLLMTSGGGLTTLETASRFPIRLVESGPAGGAILARNVAQANELSRLLSFDMGGTTAKLCLIDDFKPLHSRSFEVDRVYRFKKGSGLPVRIPVIEMVEIGAGGGSIAQIDKLGRMQVGPRSAGSEPGPAAYGRGGTAATVTDADVQLGRIVASHFANGAFTLDTTAADAALVRLGEALQLQADACAHGLSEIVDENMASAARAHASEFGLSLDQRDMVAFGGAAPLHAARLAEKLGVRSVLVPPDAGVGSAVGFLLAPVAYEVVRSRPQNLVDLQAEALNELFSQMYAEAEAVVRQALPDAQFAQRRHAYMRYAGQGHEIAVELPNGWYQAADLDQFSALFETAYRKLYGRSIEGVGIEILSWTLSLDAPSPDGIRDLRPQKQAGPPAPHTHQSLLDTSSGERTHVPVYLREALMPGQCISGPALITEAQTTTVVSASFKARILDDATIHLQRKTAPQ